MENAITDISIIKTFQDIFSTHIVDGYNRVSGDVKFLLNILLSLEIVLFALLATLKGEDIFPYGLVVKILYVGFFAFLLNNFADITQVIEKSFLALGSKAGGVDQEGSQLTPFRVAEMAISTANILMQNSWNCGEQSTGWFTINFSIADITNWVLMAITTIIVIAAFFLLALDLFVAIIEFKLMSLVTFIFIPFALFSKTIWLADRAISAVLNAGIKLLILSIIIGIGTGLFDTFKIDRDCITLEIAGAIILASLAFFMLTRQVQKIVAGFLSGTPNLTGGDFRSAVKDVRDGYRQGKAGTKETVSKAAYVIKEGFSDKPRRSDTSSDKNSNRTTQKPGWADHAQPSGPSDKTPSKK